MKKMIACFLCILIVTLFAGCGLSKQPAVSDEGDTDVSEYTMPRLESQGTSAETPQVVLDTIAFLENMFASQGYRCEYIGEDKLKVTADGTYYVNVNEEAADTDEDFYALRLYTEAADDSDADSEGTIDRYYVQQSTGSLFILNADNGTLEQMTVGAAS
jgi:hypothetical protein